MCSDRFSTKAEADTGIEEFFSVVTRNEDGNQEIVEIQPNQQAKIVVGFLEKSNVNAVEEMVNTIDQQRKFEMHVKFIQMAEELDSVGASLMKIPGM